MLSLLILATMQLPSDDKAAEAFAKAVPIATCSTQSDCTEKLSKARAWVASHSVFAIREVGTDSFITAGPDFNGTRPAYAVTSDGRSIKARVWCGNFMGCHPSPGGARTALAKAIGAE